MSNSREDAHVRRALSILAQALQEAKIKKRNNLKPVTALFGGTEIYWQQVDDDDIELQLNYLRWGGNRLHASILLKGMASQVESLFLDDAEAVKALVDSLKYIQDTISGLLPHIHQDLLVRATNMQVKRLTLSPEDHQSLKRIRETVIRPMDSAHDARRKEMKKRLRAEQIGSGRPKGSTKPIEKKAQEAAKFEREIEEAIRTLLSVTGEMPTKTAVAKELGIGGLSPKTGIDTSLNAFSNKLRRLKVDYDAVVERVRLNK
jgi:hypothetical protein